MSGIANEQNLGQLAALLASGLDSLSRNQTLLFNTYQKVVLPLDGFVFWVRTGSTVSAEGSLHFGTDRVQDEDQTIGVNMVIFTSESEITQFNAISPTTMLVADWTVPGQETTVQIAFSRRGSFYRESKLWHYSGIAVYPALSSQLVESYSAIPTDPVVSNSLPVWLSLTNVSGTTIPVYASFLIPDNAVPPYITAHVVPEKTSAIQPFPLFQWPGTPSPPETLQEMTAQQLTHDLVRLTFYGMNNQQIIAWVAGIMDYSLNTDDFGFMSNPIPQDDKRTQVEIAAIAMKKTIELDVSYYQSAADAIARRLIAQTLVTYTLST